jgi:hypothetical protein
MRVRDIMTKPKMVETGEARLSCSMWKASSRCGESTNGEQFSESVRLIENVRPFRGRSTP